MSVADKLKNIINCKNAIRAAINNKGGALTESSKLRDYATAIDNLTGGGGSGSGSVDIVKPIYAEQKTPVPNTGHLEKFFFNTKLGPAQVDALIANANLNFISGGSMLIYPILMTNTGKVISIFDVSSQSGVESGSAWLIADLNSDATYYVSPALAPDDPTHAGWIQNSFTSYDTGEIAINAELVQANQGVEIGSQNNLLTDLVCITAIVDSGKVEILKTLKDQYKLVENSLEFDGSKNTTYDYDFISNINEETKEINVIKNITINGVSTLKKYLDYVKSMYNVFSASTITYDALNEIFSYDDTSNVTNMGSMFYNCENLTSIPLLNTSKVTNMSHMFGSCTNLASIPLLNTSKVTNMFSMFSACRNLPSIPQLETANVTNMGKMFSTCTSLTSIPVLNTSKVTNMSYMFDNCTSLTSIPVLNTSQVTDMSYMFYNCTSLTSISQLNASKVTNMVSMFQYCEILTKVDFTRINSGCSLDYTFNNCCSLTKLIIRNMTTAPKLQSTTFTLCYHFTGDLHTTYNPNALKDGRIYVPDNMVNTLKSATNWSKYADIIVPLSTLEE